jgi:hypothetical protein
MSQRLRESYLQMCDDNLAMASPVGVAFYNSRMADSTINLYQTDYSHPSAAGSYLAACTFYASIFHSSPIGLSYLGGLTQSTATFLQNIASSTVLESLDVWRNGTFHADASFSFLSNANNVFFQANDVYSNGMHQWDFGDGSISSNIQEQHTYAAGTYTVKHIVQRFCSSDTSTQVITIGNITAVTSLQNIQAGFEIIAVCDAMGNIIPNTCPADQWSKGVYVVTLKKGNSLIRKKIVVA